MNPPGHLRQDGRHRVRLKVASSGGAIQNGGLSPYLWDCISQEFDIVWVIRCTVQYGRQNVFFVFFVKAINVSKSSKFMYNLSLETTVFPTDWKKTMVVPIPKAGDPTLVKNVRPISLLPLPGKILEKLAHSQIADHLETNDLFSETQHGFRTGHSTLHAVAQFTNYISKKQDSWLPTLATYIEPTSKMVARVNQYGGLNLST